jgi:hypothetical protein
MVLICSCNGASGLPEGGGTCLMIISDTARMPVSGVTSVSGSAMA